MPERNDNPNRLGGKLIDDYIGGLSRRRILKVTAAGAFTGSAATTGSVAASTDYPNSITFDGTKTRGKSRYEFEVSGGIDPDESAATREVKDTIDGSRVEGAVHRDTDVYSFSGDLTYLDVKGDADVSLTYADESSVDADRLQIVSASEVNYTFTATDRIVLVTDIGENSAETYNDAVEENDDGTWTVTGFTGNGYGDTYDFWGEISNFEPVEGDFTLFLNGEETTVTELTGQEPVEEDDNGNETYPLTIDDFDGGTIRKAWGNAGNHATTDALAHTGSHAAYRVDGSSLYDDGTGFEDAFQNGGRFLSWAIYVDELQPYTSFRLGFNGDGPPAPANYSELAIDVSAGEVSLLERVSGASDVTATTTADISSGKWYEVVAWWGHDTVECWLYDESGQAVAHLQADGHTDHGDYWWLFNEQAGENAVFDTVRFHEDHPYTGRHYTDEAEETSEDQPGTGLHVSPQGDDSNDGTQDDPWGSVVHALQEMEDMDASGTTLHVHGGTYEEAYGGSIRPNITAPEDDPAKIVGYDEAVINLSDVDADEWSGAIIFDGCKNLTVEGLTFEAANGYAVRPEGDCENLEFLDCVARFNGNTGFYSNPYDASEEAVVFRNCESYANWFDGGAQADGFAVGPDSEYRTVLFIDCTAHHNGDDGFDCHFANGVTYIRCEAYRNGYDLDENLWPESDGMGWKFGDSDSSNGPVFLYDCVAWDNERYQYLVHNNPHASEIHNCTAYDTADDTEGNATIGLWSESGEHEFRNCLSVSKSGQHVNNPEHVDDQNNSWNLDIEEPAFVSENPGDDLYLHLSAGSPAIDAGVDVGIEYGGDAPDLGCFDRVLDTEPLL